VPLDEQRVLVRVIPLDHHTLHHYTLHPTPYTLHPTPYTLHPTPCTLHATHAWGAPLDEKLVLVSILPRDHHALVRGHEPDSRIQGSEQVCENTRLGSSHLLQASNAQGVCSERGRSPRRVQRASSKHLSEDTNLLSEERTHFFSVKSVVDALVQEHQPRTLGINPM